MRVPSEEIEETCEEARPRNKATYQGSILARCGARALRPELHSQSRRIASSSYRPLPSSSAVHPRNTATPVSWTPVRGAESSIACQKEAARRSPYAGTLVHTGLVPQVVGDYADSPSSLVMTRMNKQRQLQTGQVVGRPISACKTPQTEMVVYRVREPVACDLRCVVRSWLPCVATSRVQWIRSAPFPLVTGKSDSLLNSEYITSPESEWQSAPAARQ